MIRFPKDVRGWLTFVEGSALAVYALGKKVLEIGSYCGRSTICMAQTAKSVDAVDPFDGRATPEPGDTLIEFTQNIADHSLGNVTVHQGTINEIGPGLKADYDLVFIDGAHDYQSVRNDIEWALRLLKPTGLIAFHDYRTQINPGVNKAVDELLADADLLGVAGSVALVKPSKELLTGDLNKPRVFLAMPHNGTMFAGAADGYMQWPTDGRYEIFRTHMGSSVLELNFNRLWCEALNARALGVTHFAMLHDDVCPEAGWLDVLMAEMEKHEAAVVSCVVPIKSVHGLTSTALGWGTGDPFRPIRRVTMNEAYQLPETFDAQTLRSFWNDEGPPDLFINTGCWIADLRQPWVESNVFRNVSRNKRVGGRWVADCVSEDWAFSCDLVRWGAKVMATRKVGLYHERPEFHNKSAWGSWEKDDEYGKRVHSNNHGDIRRRLAAIADRLRQGQDPKPAVCGGPAGNGPAVV